MRNFLLFSVLSLSLCATQAQAQRRSSSSARKPAVVAPQAPAEMPQQLDLPGLRQGAANPLADLGVLDANGGKTTALKSLAMEKGLALVFISNTCEEVQNQKKGITKLCTAGPGSRLGHCLCK